MPMWPKVKFDLVNHVLGFNILSIVLFTDGAGEELLGAAAPHGV